MTSQAKKAISKEKINEESILDYLKKNPEFFRNHPGILADMNLPHATGDHTVSLIEKQVAVLRERSIKSRHKLSELIEVAKENDVLFEKTQQLTLSLLKASSLTALFDTTQLQFKKAFDVESSNFLLLNDELNLTLSKKYIGSYSDANKAIPNVLENKKTLCSSLRPNENEFLFSSSATIGSAVIASRPLIDIKGKQTTLLICVGNQAEDFYNQNTGTLFVDYIADILQLLSNQLLKTDAY